MFDVLLFPFISLSFTRSLLESANGRSENPSTILSRSRHLCHQCVLYICWIFSGDLEFPNRKDERVLVKNRPRQWLDSCSKDKQSTLFRGFLLVFWDMINLNLPSWSWSWVEMIHECAFDRMFFRSDFYHFVSDTFFLESDHFFFGGGVDFPSTRKGFFLPCCLLFFSSLFFSRSFVNPGLLSTFRCF